MCFERIIITNSFVPVGHIKQNLSIGLMVLKNDVLDQKLFSKILETEVLLMLSFWFLLLRWLSSVNDFWLTMFDAEGYKWYPMSLSFSFQLMPVVWSGNHTVPEL